MTAQQQPPQTAPPAPLQPRNGFGTAGFVLGIIGLIFSFIPIVGVVAWPLVILGIVFAGVGLVRAVKGQATNKGLSIAGLIVSVIGLIICIVWTAAFSSAANQIDQESHQIATISYQVTGNAPEATVNYTTFGDNSTTSQVDVHHLPWHKDVKAQGFGKGGTMMVTTGPSGGTVTCKVTINGKTAKTATASGPMAMANCDNFGQ